MASTIFGHRVLAECKGECFIEKNEIVYTWNSELDDHTAKKDECKRIGGASYTCTDSRGYSTNIQACTKVEFSNEWMYANTHYCNWETAEHNMKERCNSYDVSPPLFGCKSLEWVYPRLRNFRCY